MSTHETYMKRCLALAGNGLGTTYPNPLVGSVIVHDGKIIGEGWHRKAGGAHAEVNAINSVKDPSLLPHATIYVSLEPCSHFGKTPPCSDLIIAHGIPNVIIGTVDPNLKVAGNGIKKLKEAGRTVTVGILEQECRAMNRRFFTFHEKKRPYLILKWAESSDGFIAPLNREAKNPVWISNQYSRQMVHKWRTEEQAILVGTQTVVDDNPMLNARDWCGENPIRVVVDKNHRISKESHIFDSQAKTIVFGSGNFPTDKENITVEIIDFEQNIPMQIASGLYKHDIQSVIIEGGRQTLQSFIDLNLWDEARIFVGPTAMNNGVKAPNFEMDVQTKYFIGSDELLISWNHD